MVKKPMGDKRIISVFYCINSFQEDIAVNAAAGDGFELQFVKMACSSMVKDVYLLRAFEAGADAVAVMVCPEGRCRHVEGSLRARKRVEWVRQLLDDIGVGGSRLVLHHLRPQDNNAAAELIHNLAKTVDTLGPNPAKRHGANQ